MLKGFIFASPMSLLLWACLVWMFGLERVLGLAAALLGSLLIGAMVYQVEHEHEGHVSEGTRRRYDEPGLRVVGGRRR